MKPYSVVDLNIQPNMAVLNKQHESYDDDEINWKDEQLKSCHECSNDISLHLCINCSNKTNEPSILYGEHDVEEMSLKPGIEHHTNNPLSHYYVTKNDEQKICKKHININEGEQSKCINNISDELLNFNNDHITKESLKCYNNLNFMHEVPQRSFGEYVNANKFDAHYNHFDTPGSYINNASNNEPLDLSMKSMSIKKFESNSEDICVRDEQLSLHNNINLKNETLIPYTESFNLNLMPLQSCSEQEDIDEKPFYSYDEHSNFEEKSDISDRSYDSCDLHIDIEVESIDKSPDISDKSSDSCDLNIDLEEKPLIPNNVRDTSPGIYENITINDEDLNSYSKHWDNEDKQFDSCSELNNLSVDAIVKDNPFGSCDLHIDKENKLVESYSEQIVKNDPPQRSNNKFVSTKKKSSRSDRTADNSKSIQDQAKISEYIPIENISTSIQDQINNMPKFTGRMCSNPNCQTITSTAWRNDKYGNKLCNACALYLKWKKIHRPSFLARGIIIPRRGRRRRVSKRMSPRYNAENIAASVPAELSNNNVVHNPTDNIEKIAHPVVSRDSCSNVHDNHRTVVATDLHGQNDGSHFSASDSNRTVTAVNLSRRKRRLSSSQRSKQRLNRLYNTSMESHQPSSSTHQPSYNTHQPSYSTHQPSSSTHQPSSSTHQPSCSTHQPSHSNENIMIPDQLHNYNNVHHHAYRNQDQRGVLTEQNLNNVLHHHPYDSRNNNTAALSNLNNTSNMSIHHTFDNSNNNCSYPRTSSNQDRNASYYRQDANIRNDQFPNPMFTTTTMLPHPEFAAARNPGFAAMAPGAGYTVMPRSDEFTAMRAGPSMLPCGEFANMTLSNGYAAMPFDNRFAGLPPGDGFPTIQPGGGFSVMPPSSGFFVMPHGYGYTAIPAIQFAAMATDHRFAAIPADLQHASMLAGFRLPDPGATMLADPRNFTMPADSRYISMPGSLANTVLPTHDDIGTRLMPNTEDAFISTASGRDANAPAGPEEDNSIMTVGCRSDFMPTDLGDDATIPERSGDAAIPERSGDAAIPERSGDAAIPERPGDAAVSSGDGTTSTDLSSVSSGVKIKLLPPFVIPYVDANKKVEELTCSNCNRKYIITTQWRKDVHGNLLCTGCAYKVKTTSFVHPKLLACYDVHNEKKKKRRKNEALLSNREQNGAETSSSGTRGAQLREYY